MFLKLMTLLMYPQFLKNLMYPKFHLFLKSETILKNQLNQKNHLNLMYH